MKKKLPGIAHLGLLILGVVVALVLVFVFLNNANVLGKKTGAGKVKNYSVSGKVLVNKPDGTTRPYRGKYGKAVVSLKGTKVESTSAEQPIVCSPDDYDCRNFDQEREFVGTYSFKVLPGTYKISVGLRGDAANCFESQTTGEEFTVTKNTKKNVFVKPTGNCADEDKKPKPTGKAKPTRKPKASPKAKSSPTSAPSTAPDASNTPESTP